MLIVDLSWVRKRIMLLIVLVLIALALLNYKSFLQIVYPLQYKDFVFKYSRQYDVDPYLVEAVMRTESKFRSTAQSSSGAMGIMQIMPETGTWIAKKMGLKGFHPDQLYDPETNIKMGCWYLADLERLFKGNHILVVAAYNGGRGNVQGWIRENKWTGEHATVEQIPFKETREYVRKVIATYDIYKKIYNE